MKQIKINAIHYGLSIMVLGLLLSSCTKSVKMNELISKDGLFYFKNDSIPFSGKVIAEFKSGKDSLIAKVDSGLFNGNYLVYYETGEVKNRAFFEKGNVIKCNRLDRNGKVIKISMKEKNKRKVYISFSGIAFDSLISVNKDNKKSVVLLCEYNYFNGDRFGVDFCCYVDGKPYTGTAILNKEGDKIDYVNGIRNGKYVKYYNGEMSDECNYVNGKREGKHYRYNNGKVVEEGYYKNDKREGKEILYWANADGLRGENNYINDKRQGMCWSFDSNHEKHTYTYVNDITEGVAYFHHPNGQLWFKCLYKNGELVKHSIR